MCVCSVRNVCIYQARDVFLQTTPMGNSNHKVFLDPHMLGVCLGELGGVLVLARQHASAKEQFEHGVQVLEAAEDVDALAAIRCRMGLLLSIPGVGITWEEVRAWPPRPPLFFSQMSVPEARVPRSRCVLVSQSLCGGMVTRW